MKISEIKETIFISPWIWIRNSTTMSLLVILTISALATYLTTACLFQLGLRLKKSGYPHTLPYWIPVFGHAMFLWWGMDQIFSLANQRYNNIPIRIKFLGKSAYILSGQETIISLWTQSRFITTRSYRTFSAPLFNLPDAARDLCLNDDSGLHIHPVPNCKTSSQNRINFLTLQAVTKLCLGPGLKPLAERFRANLHKRFLSLEMTVKWQHHSDLYAWLWREMFCAIVEALYGSAFLDLSPGFCERFLAMDKGRHAMAKRYPRWTSPATYRYREQCLEDVKRWQDFIQENGPKGECTPDDWDPVYGSGGLRCRQRMWSKMDVFGEDQKARVSEDFALIYSSTGTVINCAFWTLAEIFKDPSLPVRLRTEIKGCGSDIMDLDIEKLIKKPLLQSVYAEALRLNASTVLIRHTEPSNQQELKLNNWTYPQESTMFISNYHAQRDERVWNTGSPSDPHLVESFWADRFLIYPGNKFSGPRKHDSKQTEEKILDEEESPIFSMDGLKGAWIPYGGGSRACTGQKLAKREIISCLATVCLMFDIELDKPGVPDANMAGFGFGVLGPKQKTPFKIRKLMAH